MYPRGAADWLPHSQHSCASVAVMPRPAPTSVEKHAFTAALIVTSAKMRLDAYDSMLQSDERDDGVRKE
jgi:hypothetical protein